MPCPACPICSSNLQSLDTPNTFMCVNTACRALFTLTDDNKLKEI